MASSSTVDNSIHNINSHGADSRGIFRSGLDFVTHYDSASAETSNHAVLEKGTNSQTEVEKGQQEVENSKKEQSSGEHSDNDKESDCEAYSFSEDQKRAMEELMTQTQEDDDLPGEDPPEYNVKDTLIQLNAALANVPMPVETEREHKVVFKPTIVDLVASPPPDYSDDELQPSHHHQQSESSVYASISSDEKNNSSNEHTVTAEYPQNLADPKRQQFVVERDGKFSVVGANDLTSAEQDMLLDEEDSKKKAEKQIQNEKTKYEHNTQENVGDVNLVFSRSVTGFMTPQPPSRSRPKSVATSSTRSSHQAQSPQRRSTNQVINSTSSLNNFAYTSPYAMSCEEKAAAREQAKRMENERKERELQKRQEDDEKRIENENAFQAWLNRKMEEEKEKQDSEIKIENLEREKRDRSEDAYKAWVKVKKTQVKRERLLKRRQQEEKTDGFYLRSREQCDEAFKEWLKKKNAEVKKQQLMERQKNKLYRIQVKASRRTLAIIRALKEAQAYGYFDLHSCTF